MITEQDAEIGKVWSGPSQLDIEILEVDRVKKAVKWKFAWVPGSTPARNVWWAWEKDATQWSVKGVSSSSYVPNSRDNSSCPQGRSQGIRHSLPDGSSAMNCNRCQVGFPYVEPNQSDGTYLCYNCR